jgi:competence ComEA-like helix-hairpin-helix protein
MDEQPREKVNLNTADESELISLPGIGPALARRIVADRRKYGPFNEISDVMRVRGINEHTYSQFSDHVYVEHAYVEVVTAEAVLPPTAPEPGPFVFSVDRETDAQGESERIVFAGETYNVQGFITLRNVGDQRIRKLALPLGENELYAVNGAPLRHIVTRQRLYPGQQVRAQVSFALDSRTPPGVYETTLILGEEQIPIILQVAETLDVDIVPRKFILTNAPGSTITKTVSVTNRGNLAVELGNVGAVVLAERNQVCTVLRNSVKRFQETGVDDAVNILADELEKSFERSGTLRIRTKNQPITVLPGETVIVELEISLPSSLRKSRLYHGQYKLYNASMTIELQPVEFAEE